MVIFIKVHEALYMRSKYNNIDLRKERLLFVLRVVSVLAQSFLLDPSL